MTNCWTSKIAAKCKLSKFKWFQNLFTIKLLEKFLNLNSDLCFVILSGRAKILEERLLQEFCLGG